MSRMNLSGVLEMPVSALEIEMVFRDLEARPHFLPCIRELQLVRGGNGPDVQVGTRWREIVVFRNVERTHYKTVTKLLTDPIFEFTICNDFSEEELYGHSVETISCAIQPIDSQSCRVIWTLAYVAGGGFFHRLKIAACYCSVLEALEKHVQGQIQCYSEEAVRRRERAEEKTE